RRARPDAWERKNAADRRGNLAASPSSAPARAADAALAQGLDDLRLGTIGDEAAVVDDHQAVDQFQQGCAVRDQNEGLVLAGGPQARLELGFALVVHIAAGLVQQQDLGIVDQGARDGDRLPLPAGQGIATLADDHVVALGVAGGEFIHSRQGGGGQDVLVRGEGRGDGQVVLERAVEQHRILGHIADGAPDVGRIDLVEIDAVDQDGARSGRIELQDEFFQGGLARADAADDADLFAGLDAEADVVQRRDRAVRVGEGDALELDAALQDGPRHERAVGRALDRHAHVIVDGLQGRLGVVVLHHQAHDLAQWRETAPRYHGSGDDAAHDHAFLEQIDADDHDGNIVQLLE